MVGEHLDLTSGPVDDSDRCRAVAQGESQGRPFLGVHFVCCDVYTRIYVNAERTAYAGHCPKCSRPVRVRIGPGGTNARFFQAG
jgi:hypothetical protein